MFRRLVCAMLSTAMVLAAAPALAGAPKKPADQKETPKQETPKKEAPGPKDAKPQSGRTEPGIPAEEAIEKALAAKTSCEFVETPLRDVVDYLRELHKINIIIDKKALDDVGIGKDTTITARIANVSFCSALELILRPLDLSWTIHNEVLLITTPEEAGNMLVTKVYPVADLVAPADGKQLAGEDYDYDSLVEVITSSIAPSSWNEVGGQGSLAVAPLGNVNALVISQTYQVHRRVARLLEELRKVARQNREGKKPAGAAE